MTEWISHRAAAAIVGCHGDTINNYLGEFVRRSGHWPSLDRASVEEWG